MTVSVIINTLNRDYWLKRLLNALMHQTYDDFEIIVVNGPSKDRTNDVLQDYRDIIKIEKCNVANISVSRNIGIKASSGDIVIFIDDDAVPINKYWIEHYVRAFTNDPTLAGTGGKAYDGRGEIQFDKKLMDIWGNNREFGSTVDGTWTFNTFIGCNCAFLRKALLDIGGFDEYYEYFHDETDLEARLAHAGYKLEHNPFAHVYHEGANSAVRKTQYIKNWFIIVKNNVYFAYKNSDGYFDLKTRSSNALASAKELRTTFRYWRFRHAISKKDYNNIMQMWKTGVEKGKYDGFYTDRKLRFDLEVITEFKKIDKMKAPRQLNICLLLPEESITTKGGIAKQTLEMARGLFKAGANVHIIYCGNENVDYMEDGINYYSVVTAPLRLSSLKCYPWSRNAVERAHAIYRKVKKLVDMYNIQIIESPIWTFSGLFCAELLNVPVVTRLQTPAKLVFSIHNYTETQDMLLYYEFEKRFIEKSFKVIAISDAIADTISNLYNVEFNRKLEKNNLGFDENVGITINKRNDDKVIILFLGRLERRKGIATLLDVIPNIINKYKHVEFRLAGSNTYDKEIGTTFKKYFERKNRNIKNGIVFLGEISDEQKEYELATCDIFVSPSLYESFGIIFVEAMRYKKPVIGCKAGGMPEVISDGVTGFLCEPGNKWDLENALLTLIENKTQRKTMGHKGYERFLEMFTRDKMIKGCIDIYERAIIEYKKGG